MVRINYLPQDTKFHFRLAVPISYQNRLDSDLRFYKSKKEYAPVLLKEALVNGAFLVLFFAFFAWLNISTIKWAFFLPFAALLVFLFVWMIYLRKVNRLHKQPQQIYNEILQIFQGTDIEDNTLTEQFTYCFKFRKNDVDCEFTYNLYRKVYQWYIYPATTENMEEKADRFLEAAKCKWLYDTDEDGFFLACTLTPENLNEFKEILSAETALAKEIMKA
ncbi:hypothetical protein [Bacteroides sp. 519]|uniref:hypothetical protein n=1 Tax=Bacteroides sp. 519 TaxID=2302937 RepID=UPI0013D2C671|nr:hypothetical protein [Bacteroides sp. 519]NDV60121.1 hypothetical protein [Bacteroides sp. 519]